ncbi:hypothetical protein I3843_02G068300 [Carya illinoinensis]|nr:hypothetical protein I3843_02G068300 [Carya illinoinensis]
MASKSAVFVLLMVVVAVAAPIAVAQTGILDNPLSVIRIQGTVFCSINATLNGTASPVFPNALVQLRCRSGNVVSISTTNRLGVFGILVLPIQISLPSLLSDCNLIVTTPLVRCNATLPSVGVLRSPLQSVVNTTVGLLRVFNVAPTGFVYVLSP